MTESWRLKLYRAEEHFSDLKGLIGLPVGRQDYPLTEVPQPNGEYGYALALPAQLDETVPIIVGDLLFNIRSALDHLACALIPSDDKGRAQFPIFTSDPNETDPHTGRWIRPSSKHAWDRQTFGIPSEPLAIIESLQPYKVTRKPGEHIEHYTLAVLSALQNADKHQSLLFSTPAVTKARVFVDGIEEGGIVPGVKDGAIPVVTDHQVQVKLNGIVTVPFGIRVDVGYEYPLVFDMILDTVAQQILPQLEPLLPVRM